MLAFAQGISGAHTFLCAGRPANLEGRGDQLSDPAEFCFVASVSEGPGARWQGFGQASGRSGKVLDRGDFSCRRRSPTCSQRPSPGRQTRTGHGGIDAGRADEQGDEAAVRRQLSVLQRAAPSGHARHVQPDDEARDVRSMRRCNRRSRWSRPQTDHERRAPGPGFQPNGVGTEQSGRGAGDRLRRSRGLRTAGTRAQEGAS